MTQHKMTAWLLEGPGGPEAFEMVERPCPELQDDQVLIKVESFGLNRSELHSRKGLAKGDFAFPRVLGLECAGRVLESTASDLREGERVVALMGGMGRAYDGAYATHTVVPRSQVFRAPDSVKPEVLGAVPETYNTAWGVCVQNLKLSAQDTVLVRGGTSALGMAAAEIAKDLGCTVVATTRSEAKASVLKERSRVDHVVVEGEAFSARVIELVGPISAVVECVGSTPSIESSCATMTVGGRIGLVGQLTETWDTDMRPRFPKNVQSGWTRSDQIQAPEHEAMMSTILERVSTGRYRPNIDRVFPFDQLPQAHRVMEASGAVGKLVVLTSGR